MWQTSPSMSLLILQYYSFQSSMGLLSCHNHHLLCISTLHSDKVESTPTLTFLQHSSCSISLSHFSPVAVFPVHWFVFPVLNFAGNLKLYFWNFDRCTFALVLLSSFRRWLHNTHLRCDHTVWAWWVKSFFGSSGLKLWNRWWEKCFFEASKNIILLHFKLWKISHAVLNYAMGF